MKLKKYVDRLQLFSTIFSITLNTVLIFLIVTKSPKTLGSYKYLMIYVAIFELFYSIIDVLISPIIFSHGSVFLVIVPTDNVFVNNENILLYLDSVWCGFFGSFMALFALQFVYRYFVISISIKIKSFNDSRIIFWMSIPVITGLIWGIVVYIFIGPTEQTDNAIRTILLETFDTHIENITYIGPYLYQNKPDESVELDVNSLIAMIVMLTITITSMIFIIFFAIQCFCKLNIYLQVHKGLSKSYNSLQSQLLFALIVQTFIPLLLMHLPTSILFIFTIINVNLGYFSVIVTITTALFPALDPLPVVLIIKSYRGAICNIVTNRVMPSMRR